MYQEAGDSPLTAGRSIKGAVSSKVWPLTMLSYHEASRFGFQPWKNIVDYRALAEVRHCDLDPVP